ncbi:unnamed protein product [Spodoptera littoralis]|uniref:E3 ubiquitin-protein ligase APD1-4 middle domain-containing protein n=1 Tax=Spodoptera littoralis TaxID=7109 RepID=A0A9P0I816_SPOLI|nr:unnamed protein product [Spodoptera littoralis]CAH1641874.1 unnamed protein product [Spodoptera littoralis]
MDPQELVPLESGLPLPRPHHGTRNCYLAPRTCYTAPLRLCRLLALLFGMPTVFLMVPLYLRYRVFLGQMYPMSMTDMRLIDSKISPTWCQRQVVRSNTTFNAFVVPGPPELTDELVPVSMTRELELDDDMKEYWGFYLLKGSSVTVSACVSYPGASLIMIKGYKHLQDCAYIGDDSSEEINELIEANRLGLLSDDALNKKISELKVENGKVNNPETMKRHKSGVSFHDPKNHVDENVTSTSSENLATVDVTDHDPKELREILERLHALREAAKIQIAKNYRPPSNIMSLPALHRHRDANVDKEERKWISFQDIDGNASEILTKLEISTTETVPTEGKHETLKEEKPNNTTPTLLTKLIGKTEVKTTTEDITKPEENNKVLTSQEEKSKTDHNKNVKEEDNLVVVENEEELTSVAIEDTQGDLKIVATDYTSEQSPTNGTEPNSKEVFEDVLHRLQALGDKGKRVLMRLHETMGVEYEEETPATKSKPDIMSVVTGSGEELDRLRRVLVEAIDEEKNRSQREQKRRDAAEQARKKREAMLGHIELVKELNENDEERNHAGEMDADGYADHHMLVNETTPLDMSNSEFWSSFSSSEEALLECEGLILNLPLTPHRHCFRNASENEAFAAAKANALTYRVPANGYYFFVFNSENEVQRNYIRARFELQKTRYDVARTALRTCTNTTARCDLPLDIFSTQKVVLEVPLRNNDSLWNEQFLIISECEPRTSIYIFCVIAVPILILVFGFQ